MTGDTWPHDDGTEGVVGSGVTWRAHPSSRRGTATSFQLIIVGWDFKAQGGQPEFFERSQKYGFLYEI